MSTNLIEFSLFAKNIKCVGERAQGFDSIKTVNVVIGRNNSGKSSLIDIVEQATRNEVGIAATQWHKDKAAEVITKTKLSEDEVNRIFPANTSGGSIPGNHQSWARRFANAMVSTRLASTGVVGEVVDLEPSTAGGTFRELMGHAKDYAIAIASQPNRNPLRGLRFVRLAAERNIGPEADSTDRSITADGRGATNLIQHFINKVDLPVELVSQELLGALNAVFGPDASFAGISCRQLPTNQWEIFLEEKAKGRIPLSQSGSGLKTIILALCFVHLLPVVAKQSLKSFVFAFEELENNLHPALQRRLLSYLAKQAVEKGYLLFLTTHSSVAIDLFSKREDSQILHVTHDGTSSTVRTVKAYVESRGVLDDLDVRASDLLQSNGIVWLEGPSDRVYVNRWLSLWSDGELVEGNHYQCVFYGGRLLAHLSGEVPGDEAESGVSILNVNRNAAVLIDSDRRVATAELNGTKRRIIEQVQDFGGLAWVSDGREVENYIPFTTLQRWLGARFNGAQPLKPYESFFEYLDNETAEELGTYYSTRKPLLAEQVCNQLTKADIQAAPQDLAVKLDLLCEQIRRWNNLAQTKPADA